MIQANIVDLQLEGEWQPLFILIGSPEDFQALVERMADHNSGLIHDTRWRRLRSPEELMAYQEQGCQVRTKNWDETIPIDWS